MFPRTYTLSSQTKTCSRKKPGSINKRLIFLSDIEWFNRMAKPYRRKQRLHWSNNIRSINWTLPDLTQLPQHIVEIIKIKRNLHQRWQRNRDRTIKTQINQLTKVIKELLQNWRSELLDRKWDNLAQDAEQGKTSYWKAAKTCLKIPSPKSNLALNRNGKTLVSDKEKASGFTEIYGGIYSPAPDTDHETAVEDTWNRISEKQFRYEDDDYT